MFGLEGKTKSDGLNVREIKSFTFLLFFALSEKKVLSDPIYLNSTSKAGCLLSNFEFHG